MVLLNITYTTPIGRNGKNHKEDTISSEMAHNDIKNIKAYNDNKPLTVQVDLARLYYFLEAISESHAVEEIEELISEVEHLQQMVTSLEEEVDSMEDQIDEYFGDNEYLNGEVDELETTINELEGIIAELESQIDDQED